MKAAGWEVISKREGSLKIHSGRSQKRCRVAGRGRGGQGVKDGFMAGTQPKLRKDPEAEEVAITSTHQRLDLLDPNSFFSASLRGFYTRFFPRLSKWG